MSDLIERKPLYERAAGLEAEALDYASKLIERGSNGEATSEEWRIWSAVLAERTAFKHDVFDAPSAEPEIVRCKDCKYQEKFFHTDGSVEGGGHYVYGCELTDGYSHVCLDDDFCSRAERRTDE